MSRHANNGQFSRKYTFNQSFFDVIEKEQAWLLGLLAADGSVRKNGICLGQSGIPGQELLSYVKQLLHYTGPIYSGKTGAHALTITSRKLLPAIANYNIVPRKSLIYTFPDKLAQRHYSPFMRGYFDGDGCAGIYDCGTTEILTLCYCGTEAFVKTSAQKLPVDGRIYRLPKANNCWEFRVNGKKAVELGCWLWQDTELYCHTKQAVWERFLVEHTPLYIKYAAPKMLSEELLREGSSVSEIARLAGVPFQTIYKWRDEVKKKGYLVSPLLAGALEHKRTIR